MAKIPIGETLTFAAKEGIKGAVRSGGVRIPEGETLSKGRKPPPGATWMNPLQEQHPDVNRFFVMNFEAATPETMGRALGKDFEVKHRGGLNFSIRKPGEKKWKVVDPNTWTDMLPFIGSDWSDIAGDAFTGLASMVGALVTSPGVVTTAAGAAGAAAAAETAKQALGKLLGSSVTAGEAAKSVVFEGILGAGGEVAAHYAKPLLGAGLKAGRKALLGDVAEVTARNRAAQEVAAKETAMGAGPIAAKMETPTRGLLSRFKEGGAKTADDLALAETEGIGELLDAPLGDLRSRAAQTGIRLSEPVPVPLAKEAMEKKMAQDITRLNSEIARAEALKKPGRQIPKSLVQEMEVANPALASMKPKAKLAAMRQSLLDSIPVKKAQVAKLKDTPVTHGQAVSFKMLLDSGDEAALKEFEALGKSIPSTKPGKLAQELFAKKTTPGQKEAVGRQVDRQLGELSDFEPLEIDHILRRKSEETGLDPGDLRTFAGKKVPEINENAFRDAMQEVEGMSLDEAQDHLQKSGWKGDIPHSIDEVADRLYARRHLKLTGGGDQPTPTEGYFGSFFDPIGQKSPWHKGRSVDVTEIRAGDKTFRQGRESVEPSGLRSAALAARPLAQGVGKVTEGIGTALRAPQKGFENLIDAMVPKGFTGDFMKSRPGMALMAGVAGGTMGSGAAAPFIAIGAASLAGKGLQKLGHSLAADGSGQALIKVMTAAPADLAQKMLQPLERLQEAGPWAYRAALYTMFHQSDVREYLEDLDKTGAL